MITLNVENKTIALNTYVVEGKELYKAQDLLKGYGMDVEQAKASVNNWKRSLESKGVNFTPLSLKGKHGGTYLTKREILKLAGYVSYEFEDAVYEAFELLAEGKTVEAEVVAKTAVQIAIEKAIQNNKEGKQVGKQVSKALQECVDTPIKMNGVLAEISAGMSKVTTGKGREGYWRQARAMVEKLQKEYRSNSEVFDLSIYAQFEQVMHYCTKRIAQVRS